MNTEPTGPYVYQPYGSFTHPKHNAAGRLWAVAGLSTVHPLVVGELRGLTKDEAERVVAAFAPTTAKDDDRAMEALRRILALPKDFTMPQVFYFAVRDICHEALTPRQQMPRDGRAEAWLEMGMDATERSGGSE